MQVPLHGIVLSSFSPTLMPTWNRAGNVRRPWIGPRNPKTAVYGFQLNAPRAGSNSRIGHATTAGGKRTPIADGRFWRHELRHRTDHQEASKARARFPRRPVHRQYPTRTLRWRLKRRLFGNRSWLTSVTANAWSRLSGRT